MGLHLAWKALRPAVPEQGPYDLWCCSKDCSARFTEVVDLVKHRKEAHPDELQTEYAPRLHHPCPHPGRNSAFKAAADAVIHFDTPHPLQCGQDPRDLTLKDRLWLFLSSDEREKLKFPRCTQSFKRSVAITARPGGGSQGADSRDGDFEASDKPKHDDFKANNLNCCHYARLLLDLLRRGSGGSETARQALQSAQGRTSK